MNSKLKLGITMMTASALMFSTATSFAGTTTTAQAIPENLLEQMLAEGLITEAQMEAYLEKIEAANLATFKSELQALVTEGTLTQTKADAAYTAIVADLESAKTEREKMAAMTATELSAYLETLKDSTVTSSLDALKTAGALTSAEYTAIKAVMKLSADFETIEETSANTALISKLAKTTKISSNTTTSTETEASRLAQIETQLTALVTKGTLKQTQADLIYAAIVSDQETMTAEREKIGAMTATELTAYMEANKSSTYISALDALKTAGTITTAQYNAVQKILMPTTTKATSGNTTTSNTNATSTKTTETQGKKVKPAGVKTTTTKSTASTAATTTQSTMLTTVKTKLAVMVTKGTLTQVQADAAYTAIVADQAPQKTGSKTSALDALKTSGVLTKTQYNAIKIILAAGQVFEEETNQTNFDGEDMEQPPEPMPPMGQGQKRQGKQTLNN